MSTRVTNENSPFRERGGGYTFYSIFFPPNTKVLLRPVGSREPLRNAATLSVNDDDGKGAFGSIRRLSNG